MWKEGKRVDFFGFLSESILAIADVVAGRENSLSEFKEVSSQLGYIRLCSATLVQA